MAFGDDVDCFLGNDLIVPESGEFPGAYFVFDRQPNRVTQEEVEIAMTDINFASERRSQVACTVFEGRMIDAECDFFAPALFDIEDIAKLDIQTSWDGGGEFLDFGKLFGFTVPLGVDAIAYDFCLEFLFSHR